MAYKNFASRRYISSSNLLEFTMKFDKDISKYVNYRNMSKITSFIFYLHLMVRQIIT